MVKKGGISFYLLQDTIKGKEKWNLQRNCADVLKRVLHDGKIVTKDSNNNFGSKLTVLSINWSKELIKTILFDSQISANDYTLLSNDLEYENCFSESPKKDKSVEGTVSDCDYEKFIKTERKTTGKVIINIQSALGKENQILRILAGHEDKESPSIVTNKGEITVYIGDSITDILAMYRSDVGILVGASNTFKKVAKHFGIEILPLCWARINEFKNNLSTFTSYGKSEGLGSQSIKPFVIYSAASWDEINLLLYGDSIVEKEV